MREDNPTQARALVDILKNLELVPYGARKASLEVISCLILRLYRLLESVSVVEVAELESIAEIEVFSNWLTDQETETRGIVEQRFFDAYLKLFYRPESGYRLRGVGDSVNASNLSRKKLGDLEAFNAAERMIVAYEIHGGKLTKAYVDGHFRSLERVLDVRREGLEVIAELYDWNLEVVFIAHDLANMAERKMTINDLEVSCRYLTYEQFFADFPLGKVLSDTEQVLVFNQLLVGSINSARVPSDVKDKILKRMSAKTS